MQGRPGALYGYATELAVEAAESSSRRTSEADLRSDLFLVLGAFAREYLEIDPSDVRQEGTGTAGRYDSLIGSAIIEYKRPPLLDSPADRGLTYRESELSSRLDTCFRAGPRRRPSARQSTTRGLDFARRCTRTTR